ncbi:MAG: ABC transporter ATP-binding protein [Pyrinomonadaceae bacterium]
MALIVHAESEPAIEIDRLGKVFPPPLERFWKFLRRPVKPPVVALRDVSLTVRRGEILGLIGRNGAGKTTLTKIIATLVQPTTGTVRVNGFDSVNDEAIVRGQIGLATAEERSFYWRLTCEQNLMFFARLYGLTDRQARRRIIELFERLELLPLATRKFSELSTGNKQKMAVARAMLPQPPVLLLDEPTRSLDPLAAEEMRTLIAQLAAGDPPVSILLTSHNLAEIEQLCQRIAIIADGSIRAVGAPSELRAKHRPTETVTIRIAGERRDEIVQELEVKMVSGIVGQNGSDIQLTFTRMADDERLDGALQLVRTAGGTVLSIETERPTLFDVLEGLDKTAFDIEPKEGN